MSSSARPISAVIITLNEDHIIEKCILALIPICDEIIVVDSGSTDQTISIAKNLGAKVMHTPWLGYGATKNLGNDAATHDWILSIDADEVVDDTLKESLLSASLDDSHQAYEVNRLPYYEGSWIKHSGWHPDWVTRLFHRDSFQWSLDKVHEQLIANTAINKIKLNGYLEHYSYVSKEDHYRRIEKYARLQAEAWIESGTKPTWLKRYFGPWFRYVKSYIIRSGYKDGKAGKAIAKSDLFLIKRQIEIFDELRDS